MYNCHVYINRTHSTKLNAHSTNGMPSVHSAYSVKQKTYLFQLHDVSVVQGCLWSTAWFPPLLLPTIKIVSTGSLLPLRPLPLYCVIVGAQLYLLDPLLRGFRIRSFLFLFFLNSEIVCEGRGGRRERKKRYLFCMLGGRSDHGKRQAGNLE